MKLTIGWWKARDGSKWNVVWVGENKSVGHSESGIAGMWDTHDGESIVNSGIIQDLITPWTEPRLRPWKREEVPLGVWLRYKAMGYEGLLSCKYDSALYLAGYGWIPYLDALEDCQHSTDGGKTWHPCGVEETQ